MTKLDRGKTETIKQRAIYVYLPSLEMVRDSLYDSMTPLWPRIRKALSDAYRKMRPMYSQRRVARRLIGRDDPAACRELEEWMRVFRIQARRSKRGEMMLSPEDVAELRLARRILQDFPGALDDVEQEVAARQRFLAIKMSEPL